MSEDFPLKGIIKFQRNFLFYKKETELINHQIYFFKEVLMSMINNLSFCNNLKIFQDTDSNYIGILSELKEIKDIIDNLPDIITFKNININEANIELLKCEDLIMKYINIPKNI